jgi:putative protease
VASTSSAPRIAINAAVSGHEGEPLRIVFRTDAEEVHATSGIALQSARAHALDDARLREQLGRLGGSPFVLAALDRSKLADGLFVPVSELNRLRQGAVQDLVLGISRRAARNSSTRYREVASAVSVHETAPAPSGADVPAAFNLIAEVCTTEQAATAADAGATEIVLDPFLRHPLPPLSRVTGLGLELQKANIPFRVRTPTIVRPEDRPALTRWLKAELPILTGHLGLMAQLAREGRDVTADYATNCFNQHTAAALFRLGARAIVLSVELTCAEIAAVVRPWGGAGFIVLAYGRPEGMTIEHCVLSAAFDRVPTTCRDLCVSRHPVVELIDSSGYAFPVATDSDCRNRLLHSRPVDASDFLPGLWSAGIRQFKVLLNLPADPVSDLVSAYRGQLASVASGATVDAARIRAILAGVFTRGHYSRAV